MSAVSRIIGSAGRTARLALLPGLMLVMLGAQPATAQINPFGDHPGGLTDAQQAAMREAIGEALESGEAGTAIQWQEGNVGGVAAVGRVYQRNGLDCATISHRFTDSDRAAYELPFCLTAEGWKVYF